MIQPYLAIIGGLVLFGLGLLSVCRPREFWGIDLEQVTGKKAEARKRLIRRRLQMGTVAFLAAGIAFIATGIWQLMVGS